MVFYFIVKNGNIAHEDLDIIEKNAKKSKTKPELEKVWEELVEINKKCFHNTHQYRVAIIIKQLFKQN